MSIGIGGEGTGAGGTSARASRAAVVTDTGIALVHEGEFIYAAPGAEAEVALAAADDSVSVTVHLPVLVEMVGGSFDLEAAVDETLRRLRAAVESHHELG